MLIYLILVFYICIIWFIQRYGIRNRKLFLFGSFFGLLLVCGFRGDKVGEDTFTYLSIAKVAMDTPWKTALAQFPKTQWYVYEWGGIENIETGFFVFCKLFGRLFDSEYAVLFMAALVTSWGFARFIYKNSVDVGLSLWVYMCDAIYMSSFNLTRQMMAMAIALQAYSHIKNRNIVKSLFWILLGSMFHQSVLIYVLLIPIYYFARMPNSIKYVSIVATALPMILPYIQRIVEMFSGRYASYFTNSYWDVQLGGAVILWTFLILLIVWMLIKKVKDNEQRFLVMCAIMYMSIEIIALRLTMFSRVALFFRTFLVLLYPIGKSYFRSKGGFIYSGMLCSIMLMQFISTCSSESRIYSPFWLD